METLSKTKDISRTLGLRIRLKRFHSPILRIRGEGRRCGMEEQLKDHDQMLPQLTSSQEAQHT